jgi:hypothetical protein
MNDTEFAGDRVTIRHEGDHDVVVYGEAGEGRVCGACTLCCKLLPIPGPPLHKPAGTRCRHQKALKGCTIYQTRPTACRAFACRWVADPETAGLPRPDRAHYVLDIMPDYVEAVHDVTGERHKIGMTQVWCDPAFPNAWRTPELRAYLLRMAADYRAGAIIRFSSLDALMVFPPPLNPDGEWLERRGEIITRDPVDHQIMADLERRP